MLFVTPLTEMLQRLQLFTWRLISCDSEDNEIRTLNQVFKPPYVIACSWIHKYVIVCVCSDRRLSQPSVRTASSRCSAGPVGSAPTARTSFPRVPCGTIAVFVAVCCSAVLFSHAACTCVSVCVCLSVPTAIAPCAVCMSGVRVAVTAVTFNTCASGSRRMSAARAAATISVRSRGCSRAFPPAAHRSSNNSNSSSRVHRRCRICRLLQRTRLLRSRLLLRRRLLYKASVRVCVRACVRAWACAESGGSVISLLTRIAFESTMPRLLHHGSNCPTPSSWAPNHAQGRRRLPLRVAPSTVEGFVVLR